MLPAMMRYLTPSAHWSHQHHSAWSHHHHGDWPPRNSSCGGVADCNRESETPAEALDQAWRAFVYDYGSFIYVWLGLWFSALLLSLVARRMAQRGSDCWARWALLPVFNRLMMVKKLAFVGQIACFSFLLVFLHTLKDSAVMLSAYFCVFTFLWIAYQW